MVTRRIIPLPAKPGCGSHVRDVYLFVEETPFMIQAIYKGIEIEMEMHQQPHDYWKCDYTL